ncbi:MAG TPA: preprotein translocase subunit SecG [Syntrophales bacterium]|nr:preprotein translocase subunit SecG [Syntrophales bacterium]
MHIFFTILHVLVCVALILVVLLQAGRGANMGAVFGGSSQTIFGSSGPGTFLGKMTTVIAVIFMLTSLGLSYLATQKGGSMVKPVKPPVSAPAPTAPAPPVAGQPQGTPPPPAPAAPK